MPRQSCDFGNSSPDSRKPALVIAPDSPRQINREGEPSPKIIYRWLNLSLAEAVQFRDESDRPTFAIANLPSQFLARRVQQNISGITIHIESLIQFLIGLFERGVLFGMARK